MSRKVPMSLETLLDYIKFAIQHDRHEAAIELIDDAIASLKEKQPRKPAGAKQEPSDGTESSTQ